MSEDIIIEIPTESIVIEMTPEGKDGTDGEDGANGLDGNGIASIEKIGTEGLVDTYRITFTNGDTFDYTVTNGTAATGNFELIESVTLDADTASFVRTEEPDGTPYAFSSLLVLVTFQPRSTSSDYHVFCGASANDRVCLFRSISAVNYGSVLMEIKGGRLFVTATNSAYRWNNSSTYLTPNANGWIEKEAIDYIRIQNTSYDIAAGTKIEIYAMRN